MQPDSRKVQRFAITLPAFIESQTGHHAKSSRELLSRDVSSNGAFFLTSHPLEVGTRLVVRMVLKPQHIDSSGTRKALVTVGGHVLRKESEGMAVRFDKTYKIASVPA